MYEYNKVYTFFSLFFWVYLLGFTDGDCNST